MTELADKLETMLRNSYQGLLALYNNQDYNTFKQLNNQNDQISRYVRTVFGVR
jgi:ABC-type transporter MlaC component